MDRGRMLEIIREEGFAFPGESLVRLCRRMEAEGLRMAAEIAKDCPDYYSPPTVADAISRMAEQYEKGGEA